MASNWMICGIRNNRLRLDLDFAVIILDLDVLKRVNAVEISRRGAYTSESGITVQTIKGAQYHSLRTLEVELQKELLKVQEQINALN